MIIRSVKLKNIRSYLNQEITFPQGTILLSGDIGSGKSSILHAIEFALFGILRGELLGTAILRHGKNEGFVEVLLRINDEDILIRRNIKRTSIGVSQDTGYIIRNGEVKNFTALELKSEILKILNYPESLVSKGRSLIYRYTVYTPQEEMKQILFEKPEERLNVIRKIFHLDRYRTIRENCNLLVKEIKRKIEENENKLKDEELIKKEKEKLEDEVKKKIEEKNSIEKQKEEIERKIKLLNLEFDEIKKKIKIYQEKRRLFEAKNSKFTSYLEQKEFFEKELLSMEKKGLLKEEIEKHILNNENELKILLKKEEEIDLKLKVIDKEIRGVVEEKTKHNYIFSEAEKRIKHIESLNICPICFQVVGEEHKHKIKEENLSKISETKNLLEKLSQTLNNLIKESENLNIEKEKIKMKIREKEKIIVTLKNNREQLELIQVKKNNLEKINSEIEILRKDIEKLKDEIKTYERIEEDFEFKNKVLRDTEKELSEKKVVVARLETEQKSLLKSISELEKNLETINKLKENIVLLKKSRDWLYGTLSNIAFSIEKNLLFSVHKGFNEYFREWFDILIEDENISVRLDETFTPVIQQNGYETTIENLSGGEKTAVSLAYRLSLAMIINSMMVDINTKDIIILDEPTDGFSSEQLDRVKDVLDRLRFKQIILVSHEPKLESFAQHIIRVTKEEHSSRAVSES